MIHGRGLSSWHDLEQAGVQLSAHNVHCASVQRAVVALALRLLAQLTVVVIILAYIK